MPATVLLLIVDLPQHKNSSAISAMGKPVCRRSHKLFQSHLLPLRHLHLRLPPNLLSLSILLFALALALTRAPLSRL